MKKFIVDANITECMAILHCFAEDAVEARQKWEDAVEARQKWEDAFTPEQKAGMNVKVYEVDDALENLFKNFKYYGGGL